MSISDMTALELGRRIQSGDITAVQAAEASLARIKAMEPSIHAFVTVNEEKTMEQAGKVQADIEVTLLPQPDSPTIPRVSPWFTEKLTSSTAVTVPLLVLNCVFKCLTSNNGCAIFYLLCRAGTGNIPVPLLRHDYSTCHSQTERFKRL